ncbi:MAG: YggS family pyridoxal phosphate-dependent enzyme [Isosphaeraceae bacterium]
MANVEGVRGRIAEAARRAGRDPASITLVGVAKRRSAEATAALAGAGVLDIGENYPQELWEKAKALADRPIRWHLIGHLQGNKARRTAPLVAMIHAVDSLKLLRLLDGLENPPRACLQVNASGEASKHGWEPHSILDDALAIAECSRVPVVGLMTMAAPCDDPEQARPAFARLREVRDELRERTGLDLPELSMGMSDDFEAAIAEGATLLRIGSSLFEGVEE